MKVLLISTSNRKDSSSLRTAHYLAGLFQTKSIEWIEIIGFDEFDFPRLGSSSLNRQLLSSFQSNLVLKWSQADLVVFCCPEYNWATNAELYQALEHLGRPEFLDLFQNKVFGMTGVSTGRGGKLSALDAGKVINKLIGFLGGFSIVSPKIFEAHEVRNNIDASGQSLGNPIFERESRLFVDYTFALTRRWMGGSSIGF